MKKSYCLKIKRKKSQKKLHKKSGRRESPVFCTKNNSAKICICESLEYNKGRNKKREYKKQKCKRSCRGSNPQFSFIGNTPLLNFVLSLFGRTGGYDFDGCRFCCVLNTAYYNRNNKNKQKRKEVKI